MDETRRRPTNAILGILVVISGLVYGSSKPSSSSGEDRPKASGGAGEISRPAEGGGERQDKDEGPKEDREDLDHDYRKPYLEFRGPSGAGGEVGHEGKRDLGELLAVDSNQMAPQFLIATVPDPIDSRFGYRFDAILDAIQMAVESQGWNLDRFWLPWRPSGNQPPDHATLAPVLDKVRKAPLHELDPGVMLFRKPRGRGDDDPKQQVLVVLLVGEIPTSGIAKGPLTTSLEIIRSYHRYLGHEDEGEISRPRRVDIRIMGPTFTGSEQSLALAISGWLEEACGADPGWSWHVYVRSGGADGIDKKKFERDVMGERDPSLVEVRFDATVLPLDSVMGALFRFLEELNGRSPLGKVALLTESDTEFGKLVTQPPKGVLEVSPETDTGGSRPRTKINSWVGPGTSVTVMKFPFHISQVAIAYDQNKSKEDRNTPRLVRPSSRLSIPFDETGRPRDIVPALSPAMTTATDEFVMAKILETISMEDFRYIGILASDTRDMLFLAGLIRRYCPDVQLFAPAGDLLLGHPRYADELHGMILATPYPLFSMAQRWDPPYEGDRRRHLFSNQGDQGAFNATLSLLYDRSDAPPNPNRRFFKDLYDYGIPFDELEDLSLLFSSRVGGVGAARPDQPPAVWPRCIVRARLKPALWLSVVGQRGLWPVQYRDVVENPGDGGYTFDAKYASGPIDQAQFADQFLPLVPQFTWQWGTVVLGLDAIAWLLLIVPGLLIAVPGQGRGHPLLDSLRPIDASRVPAGPERRWRRRDHLQREGFIVSGLVVFLVVYAYCALYPCWIAFLDSPWALVLRNDLWHRATRNDQWNLRFSWLAFWSGHVTASALAFTIARRVGTWLDPGRRLAGRWVLLDIATLATAFLVPAYLVSTPFERTVVYLQEQFLTLLGFEFDPQFRWLGVWSGRVVALALAWAIAGRAGSWFRPGWRLERGWVLLDVAALATVCLVPALFVTPLFEWTWVYLPERFHTLLSFERMVNLADGVSPLVPVLLLALVFAFWTWCQLRRLSLVIRFWGPPVVEEGALARLDGRAWEWARTLRDRAGPRLGGRIRRRAGVAAGRASGWLGLALRRVRTGLERIVSRQPQPILDIPGAVGSAGLLQLLEDRPADPAPAETEAEDPGGSRVAGSVVPPGPVVVLYEPRRERPRNRVAELRERIRFLERLLRGFVPAEFFRPSFLAATGMMVIALFRLWQRALPSVDFPGDATWWIMTTIWLLAFSIVMSLSRFLFLWGGLRALLRDLVRMPMIHAFDRIPPVFSRSFGRYLDEALPSLPTLTIPVQQWARVARGFDEVSGAVATRYFDKTEPDGAVVTLDDKEQSALARIKVAIVGGETPCGPRAAQAICDRYEKEMKDLEAGDDLARSATWYGIQNAARACIDVLDPFWAAVDPTSGYGESSGSEEGGERPKDEKPAEEALRNWVREAEDLIALDVVMLVSQYAVHLRNLAYYLAVGPILLMLAVSSYPFQPQQFLQFCLGTILLAVVGSVVWVYVQIERDELLSRVSKTTPDRIEPDRTFFMNILTFLVPLIGVALAQFPYVSDMLGQWLAPISRVVK